MTQPEKIGIKGLHSLHYYVHDLERSRKFYTELMDFEEVGASGSELSERGRQKTVLFRAGRCQVMVSQPLAEDSRAGRFLKRHPDGVGTINFNVENAEHAFRVLESRGATPLDDIHSESDENGTTSFFSIATPFGGSTFRFVENKGFRGLFRGFDMYDEPRGGTNRFGFSHFDHITSNFETMAPALLWLEHVMGCERYWNVQFHTSDVVPDRDTGSGLRSTVMHEPESGIKFANNEPMRPYFRESQINLFAEDHRGDGIQHAAIEVGDIIDCVKGLRERGIEFMATPGSYYDMLPARIQESGIEAIEEDVSVLRELGILVDGEEKGKYMLQIFLREGAGLYKDESAGWFFYEIIKRKGDKGFGAGNFRALFESIEREQRAAGRV